MSLTPRAETTLPESRLYTFIDRAREYALYFLEGQKLIQDLALRHGLSGRGFAGFRDVVLSVQPLIALLKRDEQIGFYIDSDRPEFYVKIETNHGGATRCMIWPEGLPAFPDRLHGAVRVQKVLPGRAPYESILKVEDARLREVVNRILTDSYQVNCALMLADDSDQSILLHQLPPLPGEQDADYTPEAVRERRAGIESGLVDIFSAGLVRPDAITAAFSGLGFRLLADREVCFRCSCSRERMIQNLRLVREQDPQRLFAPGQEVLDLTCEYCKTGYRVTRAEVDAPPESIH